MNRWKASLLFFILVIPTMTAHGQQLPANAPTRQQVLTLFEAIQLRRTMQTTQDLAMQNATNVAQQMMRQNGVTPTAETQRQMEALTKGIMEDVRAVLPVDEMLEAVIPIYQRHFTSEDIDAIIAFQNSPVGKKAASLQPVMAQESIEVLTPLQQRALPELMKRMNERIQKILATAQPQGVPPVPAAPRN
jgi:uncharacterized protein